MEQVRHLEVLIGDVLDVSHMQSGRFALRYTSVDLGRLCQHIVQLMQWGIDQQQPGRYCILCRVDQELPLVWADADRVQQVLTNLVENAIKYSPNGGYDRDTGAYCSQIVFIIVPVYIIQTSM